MKFLPEKVEGKLFVMVLLTCLTVSLVAAQIILVSEKARFTQDTEERLTQTAKRQSYEIYRIFDERVSQGIAASKQVLEALTASENEYADSDLYASESGVYRGNCPKCISSFRVSSDHALTEGLKAQINNTETSWQFLGPTMRNDFASFYVITRDGLLRSSPPSVANTKEDTYQATQDPLYLLAAPKQNPEREPVWSSVRMDTEHNTWVSSLIIPLYDGDTFMGVTVSDYVLDDIFRRVNQLSLHEGFGQAFLYNDDGMLVAHPNLMAALAASRQDGLPMSQVPDPILEKIDAAHQHIQSTDGAKIDLEFENTPLYAYVQPVGAMGWNLVVYADDQHMANYLASLRWKFLSTAVGIALLLVIVLRSGFRRLFLSRILALEKCTRTYSKGKRFKFENRGHDEIGNLVDAFEEMIASLERREAEIVIQNRQLQSEVLGRAKAMASMEESERKFRTLFEKSSDAVLVLDESRCIDGNEAAKNLLESKETPQLVDTDFSIFRNTSDSPWESMQEKAFQLGKSNFEWMYTQTDSTVIWLDVMLTAIPFQGRKVLYVVLRDISDRKHEEEERTRLSTAIEQAAESIMVTDSIGNILYINPAFQVLNGYGRDEIIGRHIRMLCSDETANGFAEELAASINTGAPWKGKTAYIKKDEIEYQAETTISPVRDAIGEITNFVWVSHDITKESTLESQLIQAQKMEAIGELASGIAHEINTPTQYIGDNIRFFQESFGDIQQLLEKYGELRRDSASQPIETDLLAEIDRIYEDIDLEYLVAEVPVAIEQSLEGNNRVAEIIRAMKEFAHPGSEVRTCIDVNHAIQNTMSVARNEWKYVATVETDLTEDLPLVPCLPGASNQVILNIFVNAAHAIDEAMNGGAKGKGTIRVSTREDDGWIEIRISDSGTGIPKEIQSKIFNPFFTTKAVGKGTGQGLALAHAVIVEKHFGTIQLESEVGSGTTFIIRLPLEMDLERLAPMSESDRPTKAHAL